MHTDTNTMTPTHSPARSSTHTPTKGRRRLAAAAGIAGLVLAGALVPATAASADDRFGPDNLNRVCNGDAGMYTSGITGDCTFEVQSESGERVDWLRYGEPVSNCNEGTTTAISSQVGDVRSFAETWKSGGGVSLEIKDVLTIEGGAEYSQTRTTTSERRDTVTANPGRKTAVTLGTGFAEQTGRIRVDVDTWDNGARWGPRWTGTKAYYIDDVHRTVPTGYTEKGQDEVGCDSDFRVPA
ncbi:hypothetical protein [Cryobacterium arcticum]|uniref:hypothetical protein n=1 Tax=Cryobacterium arcticum TaxID=670052 RepID=UPI00082D9C54|nr:hypothetical protein [Cryobacterium arcticum]